MNRKEAIALLKEISANQAVTPTWISLVGAESGWSEIHIKPEGIDLDCLKLIVKKHNLVLKEAKGLLVVCREHDCPQGS